MPPPNWIEPWGFVILLVGLLGTFAVFMLKRDRSSIDTRIDEKFGNVSKSLGEKLGELSLDFRDLTAEIRELRKESHASMVRHESKLAEHGARISSLEAVTFGNHDSAKHRPPGGSQD